MDKWQRREEGGEGEWGTRRRERHAPPPTLARDESGGWMPELTIPISKRE